MGIGVILLFALFSIEVSHGADIPTLTHTAFEDRARDVLQFSERSGIGGNRTQPEYAVKNWLEQQNTIQGKTANLFGANDTLTNERVFEFDNWLAQIQRDSTPKNDVNSAASENGNFDGAHKVITVAKTGVADFRRVQDAVDAVPKNNEQRVIIYIQAGTYKEKVFIPKTKPYITFQGQGKRSTIISWDDDAFTKDNTGRNLGIFNSATVAVESDHFIAADISFQNCAYYPNSVIKYRQAVALRISGDKAMFFSCGVFGHQDTLFDNEGRHYFYNCTIKGSVDFIFGNGRSIYERCVLRSLSRLGAITAQDRSDPNEPTGFAFVKCRINGSGHPLLGRAWGDFSRVVYVHSKFDIGFDEQTWSDFGHPHRQSTSFYGMYKCKGPGAEIALRSRWTKELSAQQAKAFIDTSFINSDNWLRPYAQVTLDARNWNQLTEKSISKPSFLRN